MIPCRDRHWRRQRRWRRPVLRKLTTSLLLPLRQIDIGARTQARLIKCGITTVGHLANIKGRDIPGLRSTTKKDLILAAEWKAKHPELAVFDFNADAFFKFCEETERNEALA